MQKTSGARYSPTDCTDVHRLGGYGIPAIPTQPPNYLPTEFRNHSGWRRTFSHRLHRLTQIRRVWHPCHTHAAKFCVFCEFCGRTTHHNHLCSSVPSVGEKIFPQNAHTEPSGREESPTDEHGCSQIRREVCQNSLILKKSQSPDFHKPGLCYV